MTPVELWLPIGAAAFYLYDATLLLWQNELLYVRAGARWQVMGGAEIRIGARRLCLPHPLLPQRPQFLVRWSSGDPRAERSGGELPGALFAALRPIGAINLVQVLLLCALPIVLWSLGTGWPVLGVFTLFYLLTLAALAIAYLRRRALALSIGGFWLLALDGLACAPFAVNLCRKLALRHGLPGEPLRFAAGHFDAATVARMRELVAARIREEHAAPEAAERQYNELRSVLARLEP